MLMWGKVKGMCSVYVVIFLILCENVEILLLVYNCINSEVKKKDLVKYFEVVSVIF